MYRKKSHLHFVGIGGIGMSGIAKILHYQGYTISGCDSDLEQKSVIDLKKLDCQIYQGNNNTQCDDSSIDILVYSSVIQSCNPEIVRAQQRGIPTIGRALMLAELMRTKFSIAIAGAHGKTTTTSLIAHILIEAQKDPTVIIGGHLKNISSNAQFGLGDFLVAEADESDRSLIHLQATLAVITNIDLEHLDVYADIDDIKAVFTQFLNNIPFYGKAIVCIDSPHIRALLPLPHLKIIKYGLDSSTADIFAQDINLQSDRSHYNVYNKNVLLGAITIHMPGIHNVLNCLAAIALAVELRVSFKVIVAALATFKGIERRFGFKKNVNGIEVFDDYGHHPEEIRNTLIVAKKRAKKNLIVIFQPHRYSRTDKLWDAFIEIFLQSSIDHLIITDIYAASEHPLPEITSQNLVKAIILRQPKFKISYAPYDDNFIAIKEVIEHAVVPDDLLLLQGAGKIYKLADFL